MTKAELTLSLMKAANIAEDKFHACNWSWWQNPVNQNSWRLSQRGHELFRYELKVQALVHTVTSSLKNNRMLLLLEKHLTTPFYILSQDRIVFFSENDSIMITLLDDNIEQYLKNFSR